MTPMQAIVEKLQSSGREVRRSGAWMTSLCPVHADTNASLGIKEDPKSGKAVVKCFAGCSDEDVLKALGLDVRDLFPAVAASRSSAALAVEQLAAAKNLPTSFLRGLGLKEFKDGVVIPYYLADHSSARARLRLALTGDDASAGDSAKVPTARN